ncbi:MAG: hypothetical protein KDN22_20265 [Verrucomicrobiae bacterium]|nr:hypothetical protein [Verrucomicrobiae bacterium]
METFLIFILWLSLCSGVNGQSEEMIKELNAPVPSWMSLAEPVRVEPMGGESVPDPESFRPRSGGATNSRNRVQIPARGIEFQVDYSIDWTGNNAEGLGVSLSPDGTKLIVNSGLTSHLYEITPNGEHREIPVQVPHITYDKGVNGFITKWSWADNDLLVGRAGITDESGHVIVEVRLYVFHLEEMALARLDLSALEMDSNDPPIVGVVSVGKDLSRLVLSVGDERVIASADLKSPPKLLAKSDSDTPTSSDAALVPSGPELEIADGLKSENTQHEQSEGRENGKIASGWPFVLGAIAVLGVAGFLIRAFLRDRAL